jgi:hypothetical protein
VARRDLEAEAPAGAAPDPFAAAHDGLVHVPTNGHGTPAHGKAATPTTV